MKRTVIWTPTAQDELMLLWLAASNQAELTAAADAVERDLSRRPEQIGVVLFDSVKQYVFDPIGIEFEIVDADHIVNVLKVWIAS